MIPVNQPLLDGNEKRYLLECIESGWISSEGPFVRRFEEAFAARAGRKYGVAVCNGSAALETCVAALKIGPGDEVIMPAFTIISCAAPVVRAGARPVLVDSDSATWNMEPAQIEARITPRTRAIMVVHLYGLPSDMDPIMKIARKHALAVIEDAAEMLGQTYRGRPCGSFGELSAFSFYPNKHVTTGEGGMVLTDDAGLAERCRSLRNLCFKQGPRFVHEELGWNFRMTNLQAALGLAQLERLDESVRRKRAMGAEYTVLLRGTRGVRLPLERTEYAESIYWVYGMLLEEHAGIDAREAMRRLGDAGVGTRPFFWPMHRQPVFERMGLFAGERYPVAEALGTRGFYVPSGLALTRAQIGTVAQRVKELMA